MVRVLGWIIDTLFPPLESRQTPKGWLNTVICRGRYEDYRAGHWLSDAFEVDCRRVNIQDVDGIRVILGDQKPSARIDVHEGVEPTGEPSDA